MREIDGFELSPRRGEYLMRIRENGGSMRTGDLSREAGVDPSTITRAMADLAVEGYVVHTPYHGVVLTRKGTEYATFLVRRHRILGLVLSRFGFPPGDACREASRFEGHVSKETIDRICTSLGHPATGVCGNISPDTCCCCPREE